MWSKSRAGLAKEEGRSLMGIGFRCLSDRVGMDMIVTESFWWECGARGGERFKGSVMTK